MVTGEFILPPAKTGRAGASTLDSVYSEHRNDRVYVTSNYGEACTYAVTELKKFDLTARRYAGRGYVYEVEPIGALELDPDYGFLPAEERKYYSCCEAARIIAEYRPSWDTVGFRCLRQLIEDHNKVSLYSDNWPRNIQEFLS